MLDLFEKDEREDSVRPQPEVVGGEALPEREEALVLHNLGGRGWERQEFPRLKLRHTGSVKWV